MRMNRIFLTVIALSSSMGVFSQTGEVNITAAVGNTEGSISFSYGKDWELLKSKKIAIGVLSATIAKTNNVGYFSTICKHVGSKQYEETLIQQ